MVGVIGKSNEGENNRSRSIWWLVITVMITIGMVAVMKANGVVVSNNDMMVMFNCEMDYLDSKCSINPNYKYWSNGESYINSE